MGRMNWNSWTKFAFSIVAICIPSIATADVLELRNGNRISGRWLNSGSERPSQYEFETDEGAIFSIASKEVVRVIQPTAAEQEFLTNVAPKLGEDIALLTKAIEWCSKKGLTAVADAVRQRIIDIDAENKSARDNLDYIKTDDGWVRQDRFFGKLGMIKKGTWRFPEDIALEEAKKNQDVIEAKEGKEFQLQWNALGGTGSRADAAQVYFQQVKNPNVVPKIAELMKKGTPPQRAFLIDILGRIRSGGSVALLGEAAINDSEVRNRQAAIEFLKQHGKEMAVANFELQLRLFDGKNKSPEFINRCGRALAELGDVRSLPVLIDRLITEHVSVQGKQGETNAGMASDGGVNFSPKSSQVMVKVPHQNDEILRALQTISNENFQYDQASWRNWYAEKYAKTRLSLRRDP